MLPHAFFAPDFIVKKILYAYLEVATHLLVQNVKNKGWFFDWICKTQYTTVLCAINTKSSQNTRKVEGQKSEVKEAHGLYAGHAYSLLQAEKVRLINGSTVNLVRIRNPWGKCEWNREWSDHSAEWNDVSPAEKKRISFEPEHVSDKKGDGVFWMTFKDWTEEFEKFSICKLPLR